MSWAEIIKKKAAEARARPATEPPVPVARPAPTPATIPVQTSAPAVKLDLPAVQATLCETATAEDRKRAERMPLFSDQPTRRAPEVPCILTARELAELNDLIKWWFSERHPIPTVLIQGRFPWLGPAVTATDGLRQWIDGMLKAAPCGYPQANVYHTLKLLRGLIR